MTDLRQMIETYSGPMKFIEMLPQDKKSNKMALWQCLCGNINPHRVHAVIKGRVKSCGCRKRNWKHGLCGAPTHNSWKNMFARCLNKKQKHFKHYGGRGIKICERWMDFNNFLADMGERPSLKHSIDRIDCSGNYEPGNCRWATQKEQMNNIRRNKKKRAILAGGNE